MYLYHATLTDNIPSIKEKGLLPQCGKWSPDLPLVYFAPTIRRALSGSHLEDRFIFPIKNFPGFVKLLRRLGTPPEDIPIIWEEITVIAVWFDENYPFHYFDPYLQEYRVAETIHIDTAVLIPYWFISVNGFISQRYYDPGDELNPGAATLDQLDGLDGRALPSSIVEKFFKRPGGPSKQ